MKMNDDLFAVIVTFMIMGFLGSILIYVAITKTDDALGEWTAFKQEHSCHLISVDKLVLIMAGCVLMGLLTITALLNK